MPLHIFYKMQGNFEEAQCCFYKNLHLQNVLLMLLFSVKMKQSHLLMAKNDVNNYLLFLHPVQKF